MTLEFKLMFMVQLIRTSRGGSFTTTDELETKCAPQHDESEKQEQDEGQGEEGWLTVM